VHPSVQPRTLTTGQARDSELPAEFELLCWNVYKQRRRRFEAELEQLSTEVELLVLQEATDEPPIWTLEIDQREWALVVAFEHGRDRTPHGVATASTAEPVREQAMLSPVREPLIRTPKSALLTWVELERSDSRLLLVNLHAVNFRPARALDAQLLEIGEAIATHTGPLVVAGDFNTWSRRRRAVVEQFAQRHGLASLFRDVPGRRLDDVFVRGLVVRDVEVFPSRGSDHDALWVSLAVDD